MYKGHLECLLLAKVSYIQMYKSDSTAHQPGLVQVGLTKDTNQGTNATID